MTERTTATNTSSAEDILALAERFARMFSTPRTRECFDSLRSGDHDWTITPDEVHRTRPYPMGFYNDDPNLYWAIGWGTHTHMWPWERWLLKRAASLRATAIRKADNAAV